MTQDLDLITTFGKSDGGTHDWKYKGLDPNLSAPEIKKACELLTNLDICTENGVKLFDSVITAKVVITKETIMFDPEHETKGVTYYGETVEKPIEKSTFEATGDLKQTEQGALPTPIVPLMEISKQKVLPTIPRLHNLLTKIKPMERPEIRVEKESLPQPKTTPNEDNRLKQNYVTLTESDSVDQDTKERTRLLHWIHKIRKRNKEGPPVPKRE
ncbi:hypothetical protein [Enterococcus sp.]|uniref:hypothetical protein n=1 Tax=Enterococcus sp. TaxID=35783 RepID=UPI0029116755|nr:hypothetical protein [Enterococcus sp.]MDU5335528.1 hypothetical protein [Enterococcus sp.]